LTTELTLNIAGLIDTFKIVQSIDFWCPCYKTFFLSELQSNRLENFSLKVCNKGHGLYSQHFIFFVTYKWAQLASVLNNFRMEWLATDKRPNLLNPFVSYEENEEL
jgi:hypothetical protein